MPLFFILSGYFFKEITSFKQLGNFTFKRIKGLWVPFVFYCSFFILLHNALAPFGFDNSLLWNKSEYLSHLKRLLIFKGEPYGYLPAFWFLRTLFLSSLLLALFSYIKSLSGLKWNRLLIAICVLGILLVALFYFSGSKVIKLPALSIFFLCIGAAYRNTFENKVSYGWGLLITSLVVTIICSQIFGFVQMKDVTHVFSLTYVGLSLVGFLFIMSLSFLVNIHSNIAKKVLTYIGNRTMVVLALHAIVFKFMNYFLQPLLNAPHDAIYGLILSGYGSALWLLYSFMGVVIPIVLVLFRDFMRALIAFKKNQI